MGGLRMRDLGRERRPVGLAAHDRCQRPFAQPALERHSEGVTVKGWSPCGKETKSEPSKKREAHDGTTYAIKVLTQH